MRRLVMICLVGAGLVLSATAWAASGSKLYADNCASCHGSSGKGDGPSAKAVNAPALTDSSLSLPAIMAIVRNGKGSCPSWRSSMNDGEIEAVAKHAKGLQR